MQNNQAENREVKLVVKLSALSASLSDGCMYRVHNELREVKKKAYEPVVVSIGPYHRGNDKLHMMEEYKVRYLKKAIVREKGNLVDYLSTMRSLVDRARKCYVEHVQLDEDEFTEMLLLDSCFVVEVIREFSVAEEGEELIGRLDWMVTGVERDLMLFENQLPFFVILQMVDFIVNPPYGRKDFIRWAFYFFSDHLPSLGAPPLQDPQDPGYKHLLEMIHDPGYKHLLEMIHGALLHNNRPSKEVKKDNKRKWPLIPCASKLIEAGVKFEGAAHDRSGMFHITFKDGVISIPNLPIYDITDSVLRNLIVYEQYNAKTSRVFTDYVTSLDNLINTSKDVEILSKCGIMDNGLGDDEVVSDLFNKITDSVNLSSVFLYTNLCKEVTDHYDNKMNRWLAKLKQNYLDSPWGVISVVAATTLLVLTAIQTVATVASA